MMDQFTMPTEAPVRNPRLRRILLLAAVPGVILAARMAESAEVTVSQENGEPWTIEITPRKSATNVQQLALQTPAAEATLPPAPPEPFPMGDEVAQAETEVAPPVPEVTPEPAPTDEYGIAIVPNGKFTMHGLTYRQVYDSIPYSRTEYLANPSYRHEATMELLTGTPRQKVVQSTYEPKLNTPLSSQPEFLYNRYGTFGGTFGPQAGFGYGYGGAYYIPQYAPAFRYFLPLDIGY